MTICQAGNAHSRNMSEAEISIDPIYEVSTASRYGNISNILSSITREAERLAAVSVPTLVLRLHQNVQAYINLSVLDRTAAALIK